MSYLDCRCCGKPVTGLLEQDSAPIHTKCIAKHWSRHAYAVNASRCREFKHRKLHLDKATGATVWGPVGDKE